MMVAHVVLFTPRADLSQSERASFVEALEHALVNIPLIKRARLGRRFTVGRQYDQQPGHQFPYAAILEFESAADLRAYLDHPAHSTLGEQFYAASSSALAFDFDLIDGDQARELLLS